MSAFSELLLPAGFLMQSLNAAVASCVACAIAIMLSRRSQWSLPSRHALLVAALAASLFVPLLLMTMQLPAVWSIQVAAEPDQPRADATSRPSPVRPPEMLYSSAESQSAPGISIESPAQSVEGPSHGPQPSIVPAVVTRMPVLPSPSGAPSQLNATQILRTLGTALCLVWVLGIVVCLGRAGVSLTTLRSWLRTVSVCQNPMIQVTAKAARQAVGLRTDVVVYCSQVLPAPITFGLIQPCIVVPEGIEKILPAEQLRAVLQHEMAHIARRDLWIGLLQQVAQCLHWWNPLVWLANRQLADLREQICDDIAIRELPDPGSYAATLIDIAERCSVSSPIPATLGFGSSPASQLEGRIRRIVSSQSARCLRLTRRAVAGVSAAAVLMATTILLAQVHVKTPAEKPADTSVAGAQAAPTQTAPPAVPAAAQEKPQTDKQPTLHELIQQMARHEKAYLPFQVKVMETFRISEGLTRKQRTRYPWADGRKHQRLMEYAQLDKQIWRRQETMLIDDEVSQGPYQSFSDGNRLIQVSTGSGIIDGKPSLEVYIQNKRERISNYLYGTPMAGVFCLSSYSAAELFSEAFRADDSNVELNWDKDDAKLSFEYGHPDFKQRFVLWLGRAHAWHPIRLHRMWKAADKLPFEEWEVTKFEQQGDQWRVVEGVRRHRDTEEPQPPDAKVVYSTEFKVLEAKYGKAVDEKQFYYKIPEGAAVRDDSQPVPEPPAGKPREITFTVIDTTDRPIPKATIRLPASAKRDWDVLTTNEQGVAKTMKAPEGNATVNITAPGHRPVTWIVGKVDNLRATMAPTTPGITVDEDGQPVAGAWITHEGLQFRSDGFVRLPDQRWDGKNKDWSDKAGHFELTSELTVRSSKTKVACIAIHEDRDLMAIRSVVARDLGQEQKLVLLPTCHVRQRFLLVDITEAVDLPCSLHTIAGDDLGSVTLKRELSPAGLLLDFQVRLPPGEYTFSSRPSSEYSAFGGRFTVAAGQKELDLGMVHVAPSGTVALKGKAAPPLDVQWRPGQQAKWDDLRGNVVVLDFWGTWCMPCVNEMPELMDIHYRFRDQPVKWIAIHTPNVDSFADLDTQLAKLQDDAWKKRALPFTLVIDQTAKEDNNLSGKTAGRFAIPQYPTQVVIDPQGKVVGAIPKDKLIATINRLLKETKKQ